MHDPVDYYRSVNRFGEFLGMDFEVQEPGIIHYTLPLKEEYEALPGMTHGGLIAALMDAVLGVAALSSVADEGRLVSTIEFKINYLSPAQTGSVLTGKGVVARKGKRLLVVEGEISAEGKTVALATGTFTSYLAGKS